MHQGLLQGEQALLPWVFDQTNIFLVLKYNLLQRFTFLVFVLCNQQEAEMSNLLLPAPSLHLCVYHVSSLMRGTSSCCSALCLYLSLLWGYLS